MPNRHSVPNHIPIPGPTSLEACRYGGSNTTQGSAEKSPYIPAKGEKSRPATCKFLNVREVKGQPTQAAYAPPMVCCNSLLSRMNGPGTIP